MAISRKDDPLPKDYVPLPGSERRPSAGAKLLGPADAAEKVKVTIVLRRRADGPPLHDFDYFAKTPPEERGRMPMHEFEQKYGAHPDDIRRVVDFAEDSGLKVLETHAARCTVEISGTVAQMSKAFAVKLDRYEHTITRYVGNEPFPHKEVYRGRDGFIHVPKDLAKVIVGVFGLDNRTITKRNAAGDPPNTKTVTVQQVAKLYNFPPNSAAGQTIGIVSPTSGYGGYFPSDLDLFFGASLPTVTPISADGATHNGSIEAVTTTPTLAGGKVLTFASTAGILPGSSPFSPALKVANPHIFTFVTALTATTVTLNQAVTANVPIGTNIFFNPDGETTQDICIAGAAAPGANIAVFFSGGGQVGWVDTINRAIIPLPGDPVCSVLSSSWYITNGDDLATLTAEGVTVAMVNAIAAAFQAAATLGGLTVCIAAGDTGSNSKVGKYTVSTSPLVLGGDGKAHVQYPGSDPSVLSVGGTTIGNIAGSTFDEYVWNDPDLSSLPPQWGTTGGGVSDFFGLPSYQNTAGVPKSVNDHIHVGRGVPDVAGNASYNSGYSGLFVAGLPDIGNGTSASAPHWAGLIAVINAAIGTPVGFINPSIYNFGSIAFRDIDPPPGPTNNSNSSIPGYTAGRGWDACTGWGSPDGVRLLGAFLNAPIIVTAIADSGNFGDVCLGSFADEILTINNTGFSTLLIWHITAAPADFEAPGVNSYPLAVGPGDCIDVVIRFKPTATGIRNGTITIMSNGLFSPHKISVTGTGGAPRLVLGIADKGNFGDVCVGSFVDEPLLVNNNGKCTLLVSNITSSSPDFLVPEILSYPIAIGAGDSVSLPIRFQPGGLGPTPAGTHITVDSNDPGGPRSIGVSGNAPAGKLAVTGSTFFGCVQACCREERTIWICNVGDCKLYVSSVALSRKSRHWKLINNPFPATLRPGSCLAVVIRYKATEKCPRSCDLVITSDDPTTPVKTFALLASTIWCDCGCAKCCAGCRKGDCEKRHCDPCCCQKCHQDCCDDEEEDDDS